MRFLFVSFIVLISISCTPWISIRYNIGLDNVERPLNLKEKYGESKIVDFQDNGITKFSYEDDVFKIVWLPTENNFSFFLTNKFDSSIKIIWDDVVYVDYNGSSGKVMHSGIKYADKGNPQSPSVIAKNSSLDDIVQPIDKVYFISGQYGGWITRPLFSESSVKTIDDFNLLKSQYVGKSVRIVFPIEIEGVVNEYVFSFRVNDLIQK